MIDENTLLLLLKQISVNQMAILLYISEIAKKNEMECFEAVRKAIGLNQAFIITSSKTEDYSPACATENDI